MHSSRAVRLLLGLFLAAAGCVCGPVLAQGGTPEVRAEMSRVAAIGQEAVQKRDYQTARLAFETGLQYAQAAGNRNRYGYFLDALAAVHTDMGQHERAIAYGTQALQIRYAEGNKREIGGTLNNLGVAYGRLGQWARAAEAYTHAVDAWEGAGDYKSASDLSLALAAIHHKLGRYGPAQQVLDRTLRSLEAQGDLSGVAKAVQLLGTISSDTGQYSRALTYDQRALDLFQRLGDREGVFGTLNNIGLVYKTLGQDKQAMDYYQRALALSDGANPKGVHALLSNLGNLILRVGTPTEAIPILARALQMKQAEGNPKDIAAALDELGHAYSLAQQHDKALEYQLQALDLIRRMGDARDTARILGNVGATCKAKGDGAKAAEYLAQALELKKRFASRAELAGTQSNLALVYFDLGRHAEASACFAGALENHEVISREVGDASKVGEYQDWFRSGLYRRYAHCLLAQNRIEDALVVLERGRNQGLARQAAQNRADFGHILPGPDAQRLRAALAEMNAADEAVRKGEQDPASAAGRKAQDARRRLEEAHVQLAQVRADLRARYPFYRRLSGAAPPDIATLKQLAEKNPDTLYLQWAIGAENTSLLFALSQKDGVKGFILPVGETELRKQVRLWRASITETEDDPQVEAGAARRLYTLLFAEVENAGLLDADRYARLVLVGDGPLLEVPYAALMDDDGKRLVQRMPVAVSGSLGILTWPDDRLPATAPLLCAADPVAAAGAGLPAARREGSALAALFPGSVLLVGEAATKSQVARDLTRYSLLHFATHGYLDDEDGLKSGLILAPDKDADADTALLEGGELINMKLAAQMAVLSACETGQGQKSGGEGLLGLTWAFRAAGCPSVVASLWSVSDSATEQLMVRFYQALKEGKRKDEALREAMLLVKENKAHPCYWAAFQVNGTTGAISL